MNIIILSCLFISMFLLVSGIYEEKLNDLKNKHKIKYEYIPAPSFDMMLKESNEVINY